MKTIEILSGSQKVQFTTKSVTFDNKEFLYAHMTQVVNDAENCTYTFTYEGETKTLPYLEKDAKVLSAIFSQVQKMEELKKKKSETPSEESVAKETPAEETVSEEGSAKEPAAEEVASEEPVAEEKQEENESSEANSTEPAKKKTKEKEPVDPEKQARLKKSLKIFAIVIAIVFAVSLVYYFIFGTSNSPTGTSPGNTESQQYDDIDQLIEDLQ